MKQIWEETGLIKSFIKNFGNIDNKINIDNSEDMQQIIKAEIYLIF